MATFRKKRSRKYKRRNTRKKYIKARKSRINRRSRKSLVGGTKSKEEIEKEIEKVIIEMAYKNWQFNKSSKILINDTIDTFFKTNVWEQRKFYRTKCKNYVDLFKDSDYTVAPDIFFNINNEESKFINEVNSIVHKHEWSLNRDHLEQTTSDMIKKLEIINNRSQQLVSLLNTYYNNIIQILKADVDRLKLDIDIDALISEEKLLDMHKTDLIYWEQQYEDD